MTFITNAKILLDECRDTEAAIYSVVLYANDAEKRHSFQYNISCVPALQDQCRQMANRFCAAEPLTLRAKYRKMLQRMVLRLEAAVMFVKNHLKLLEEQIEP
jgi:hypothetical protein